VRAGDCLLFQANGARIADQFSPLQAIAHHRQGLRATHPKPSKNGKSHKQSVVVGYTPFKLLSRLHLRFRVSWHHLADIDPHMNLYIAGIRVEKIPAEEVFSGGEFGQHRITANALKAPRTSAETLPSQKQDAGKLSGPTAEALPSQNKMPANCLRRSAETLPSQKQYAGKPSASLEDDFVASVGLVLHFLETSGHTGASLERKACARNLSTSASWRASSLFAWTCSPPCRRISPRSWCRAPCPACGAASACCSSSRPSSKGSPARSVTNHDRDGTRGFGDEGE